MCSARKDPLTNTTSSPRRELRYMALMKPSHSPKGHTQQGIAQSRTETCYIQMPTWDSGQFKLCMIAADASAHLKDGLCYCILAVLSISSATTVDVLCRERSSNKASRHAVKEQQLEDQVHQARLQMHKAESDCQQACSRAEEMQRDLQVRTPLPRFAPLSTRIAVTSPGCQVSPLHAAHGRHLVLSSCQHILETAISNSEMIW